MAETKNWLKLGNKLLDACYHEGQDLPADHSGRLWSLSDIMRVFQPKGLLDVWSRLENDRCLLKKLKQHHGGGHPVPDQFNVTTIDHYRKALDVCRAADLHGAYRQIELVVVGLEGPRGSEGAIDASTLLALTGQVLHALAEGFWRRKFLLVPEEFESDIDNGSLFGERVAAAFPDAALDIREAGNCFAADCATAAVFHLMRVTEWGLRALATDVGLMRVLKDKKRRRYVPLAWSEWEHILKQLPEKVDERLGKLKPGPKKQGLQEFYWPAIQDIKGIRDAWRNHVMHTRREYTMLEARAIRDHVQRLMTTLTTRVSAT